LKKTEKLLVSLDERRFVPDVIEPLLDLRFKVPQTPTFRVFRRNKVEIRSTLNGQEGSVSSKRFLIKREQATYQGPYLIDTAETGGDIQEATRQIEGTKR
jgi:hypothetical protein